MDDRAPLPKLAVTLKAQLHRVCGVNLTKIPGIMLAEPLVKRGLREFDLRPWELREGRMMITLNSSTSSFRLE
jgi:hypothetical protein